MFDKAGGVDKINQEAKIIFSEFGTNISTVIYGQELTNFPAISSIVSSVFFKQTLVGQLALKYLLGLTTKKTLFLFSTRAVQLNFRMLQIALQLQQTFLSENKFFTPNRRRAAKKRFAVAPEARPRAGGGFHPVLTALRVDKKISYAKIPDFPVSNVSGHAGELVFGHPGDTPVLVLSGRAHSYEGHSMEQVTFPIRTRAVFGIRDLPLTNAAGGINQKFRPGDFMVVTDHINLTGVNPLRGPANSGLNRFVDLTDTYNQGLRALLVRAGKKCGLRLHRGVYLAVSGPTYETPAEIRAFVRLGADAVGMSTVPEAVAARQCGLNVAGISCITNPAAGMGQGPLSHPEVLKTAKKVELLAVELLKNFMDLYDKTDRGRRPQRETTGY